jgi:hypothetical protein
VDNADTAPPSLSVKAKQTGFSFSLCVSSKKKKGCNEDERSPQPCSCTAFQVEREPLFRAPTLLFCRVRFSAMFGVFLLPHGAPLSVNAKSAFMRKSKMRKHWLASQLFFAVVVVSSSSLNSACPMTFLSLHTHTHSLSIALRAHMYIYVCVRRVSNAQLTTKQKQVFFCRATTPHCVFPPSLRYGERNNCC